MKIFICWSGKRSHSAAAGLASWLPKVIQSAKPWLSSSSIVPGTRWSPEVSKALEESHVGIVCVTPENLTAPWLLFEAGALSKAVETSRVVPFLLGVETRQLEGPLAQFQGVSADEDGTRSVVQLINRLEGGPGMEQDALGEVFDMWWPRLEPVFAEVLESSPDEAAPPERSNEDVVGEILDLVRTIHRRDSSADSPAPDFREGATFAAVHVGANVRAFREVLGLSQTELASRVAVTPGHISNIEAGRSDPSMALLVSIAKALDTHVGVLFL